MPTIQAKSIIDRAGLLLTDVSNVRWTRLEMLGWVNDGQREVAVFKPNAASKFVSLALAAGARQALPGDCAILVDIARNTGGIAIRRASRVLLDAQIPDWAVSDQTPAAKHYFYDPIDPKAFYVYPPNDGTGHADVLYAGSPVDCTNENTVLSIDDAYATALLNYVLYRAFAKDSEFAANAAAAAAYYKQFADLLGLKTAGEAALNPNANR